jgi:hypothetical protein
MGSSAPIAAPGAATCATRPNCRNAVTRLAGLVRAWLAVWQRVLIAEFLAATAWKGD